MASLAIRSFASEDVKELFERGRTRKGLRWANVASVAARKLDMLDYATEQWRVIFRWSDLGPEDVDIVDYH